MAALFSLYKFLLYFSLIGTAGDATEFSGVVVDKSSNEPLSNVYIYVIKGEEETLSGEKGNFKLLSWQKLPAGIFFEKKGYKMTKTFIKKDQKNIKVLLEAY